MTTKYQRPVGTYDGAAGLANRSKYRDDAAAVPKRAISSSKVDGDINYLVDALNGIDEASGAWGSIAERLAVSFNIDGTLKASVAALLDEWVVQPSVGVIARVSNTSFTMGGGNFSAIYTEGRRIRLVVGGVTLVGDVVSSGFGGGVTTVNVADLVDGTGVAATIGTAPTQVAYAPLTGGVQGNAPRRVPKGVTVPVGGVDYQVAADSGDLVVARGGSVVSRFTSNGVSGVAPAAVDMAQLAAAVIGKLVPSGVVVPFAAATAPNGWLLCDGSAVSRTTYADLFAVIGETHGAGNGSTTFNLPDLRGRTVFGLDNMGGTDAGRLSVANTFGSPGGNQVKAGTVSSHVLTIAELPAHDHQVLAVPGVLGSGGGSGWLNSATPSGLQGGTGMTSTGGGQGHNHTYTVDVMPPFLLLNHIIKA